MDSDQSLVRAVDVTYRAPNSVIVAVSQIFCQTCHATTSVVPGTQPLAG